MNQYWQTGMHHAGGRHGSAELLTQADFVNIHADLTKRFASDKTFKLREDEVTNIFANRLPKNEYDQTSYDEDQL